MTMQFCRSRNDGRRCTRELAHRGLHRHRTLMWTDAGADAPQCPGSGSPGVAAPCLQNGFPDGRAVCPACLRFVGIGGDGRLVRHDTWSEAAEADAADRAGWFNTFGWSGAPDAHGA